MNVGAMQQAIKQNFPTKRNEQLYLYKKFGKLLFKDDWDSLNFMDTSNIDEKDMPPLFVGYMRVMEVLTYEEKCIIVNFIFQESVKSLS